MRRLLPPAYANGVGEPRGGFRSAGSRCGGGVGRKDDGVCKEDPERLLPNPRVVSRSVHGTAERPDSGVTLMLTYFGQFLAHDLSLTPEGKPKISCCGDRKGSGGCKILLSLDISKSYMLCFQFKTFSWENEVKNKNMLLDIFQPNYDTESGKVGTIGSRQSFPSIQYTHV